MRKKILRDSEEIEWWVDDEKVERCWGWQEFIREYEEEMKSFFIDVFSRMLHTLLSSEDL